MAQLAAAVAGTVAVGAVAFHKMGWRLGHIILTMKFDGDVKKAGLTWQSVRLDGKEFWFLERPGAQGSGTPLVVVPGLASEAHKCAEWALNLQVPADRRVIILELPGQGRNYFGPDTPTITQREGVAWLSLMLSQLGLSEVDLYSFSTGAGMCAIHVATGGDQDNGPTVRKAVFVNPYLFETRESRPAEQDALKKAFSYDTVEGARNLLKILDVPCPPGFLIEAMVHERDEFPKGYWAKYVDKLCIGGMESLLPSERRASPPGKKAPQCLVIWGEKDQASRFENREPLIRVLPAGTILHSEPEAGHAGFGEKGGMAKNIFNVTAGRAQDFLYGPASKL